ncbi:tyrosine-type recombinase/integrase [Rhizobium laguerreae]|uniref:tyrosine-type recombinase/integrase n=1 Tax=Rhizobium laguerreae TaxID=1076926 RepID=UPI0028C4DA3D|nr:tyrosine-type recombinase/integrase [Rhizobium laguerreae]
MKRLGQPLKLTPHILRKAMATWLHVRGVPDALLQPRLGHAPGSRVIKSVYVKVTTEDMRASVIDLEGERRSRLSVGEPVKTAWPPDAGAKFGAIAGVANTRPNGSHEKVGENLVRVDLHHWRAGFGSL